MNWTEYQKEALKTKIYPEDFTGILYTTLGLVDEVYEFYESIGSGDEDKELGDVCWYVACLSYELGLDLNDTEVLSDELEDQVFFHSIFDATEQMKSSASKICGIIKKYIRDEQFWIYKPSTSKKGKAQVELAYIILSVYYICEHLGITWHEVVQMNLKKLNSRKQRGKLQGSGDDR
jgi:NTP pyrophosphatase (non-canonical NTP hydrolase)